MQQRLLLFLFFAFLLAPVKASADRELLGVPYVKFSEHGACYAVAIPYYASAANDKKQQGKTEVYKVVNQKWEMLASYDWFSGDVYFSCDLDGGISMVRMGPWYTGHEMNDDHIAVEFYKNENLVKGYSTKQIIGEHKPQISASHYNVFKSIEGLKFEKEHVFVISTVDGRRLFFDVNTGQIIRTE